MRFEKPSMSIHRFCHENVITVSGGQSQTDFESAKQYAQDRQAGYGQSFLLEIKFN